MTDSFRVELSVLHGTASALGPFQQHMRDSLAQLQTIVDSLPWEGSANARFRELFAIAHANVALSVEATSDVAAILTTAHDDYAAASAANTAGWGGGSRDILSVSPSLVEEAAGTFRLGSVSLHAAAAEAIRSLHGCSHMGGDDKHGVEWSQHYDVQATTVLANLADVIGMIDSFAAALALTGENHRYADRAARPLTGTAGTPPQPARTSAVSPRSTERPRRGSRRGRRRRRSRRRRRRPGRRGVS